MVRLRPRGMPDEARGFRDMPDRFSNQGRRHGDSLDRNVPEGGFEPTLLAPFRLCECRAPRVAACQRQVLALLVQQPEGVGHRLGDGRGFLPKFTRVERPLEDDDTRDRPGSNCPSWPKIDIGTASGGATAPLERSLISRRTAS